MPRAVIRQWVVNELRQFRKKPSVAGLGDFSARAFMPKVIVDLWFSDYCREEDDVMGQWADDGGR